MLRSFRYRQYSSEQIPIVDVTNQNRAKWDRRRWSNDMEFSVALSLVAPRLISRLEYSFWSGLAILG